MKTALKLLLIGAAYIAGLFVINAYTASGIQTTVANQLAVDNVNGGNAEYVAMNIHSGVSSLQIAAILLWTTIVGFATWGNWKRVVNTPTLLVMLSAFLLLPSCKPYQTPVFREVKNNETAFMIPLEGNVKDQAKFDSIEYLESNKVSAKRLEIPTRWNQTGRGYDGEWIPTVIVITVDRSPVTRNWQAGSGGTAKEDQAIWVESSDSVGFSMGFNCTAYIEEKDTATFLYKYSSGSLENVMDSEIRGRIQQIAAEESAKYPLDALRDKKNEIAAAVRADIIPFFAKRGITITTVGMFGGMTYENPEIQKSIDKVFVSQQEKNIALAKFEAQKKENERIILAAEGSAKQRQIEADAEAKAITSLTNAVAQGGNNYLALKALEVQLKQTEKWNGQLPTVSGGTTPLIDAGKFLNK